MTISSFVQQTLSGSRRTLAYLSALHAVSGLATILGAFCTAEILAAVMDGTFSMKKAVPSFAVLLFVVLGKALLTFLSGRRQSRFLLQTEERLRARIHHALLTRSPLWATPETGGQLLGLACESVARLDRAFTTVLPCVIDLAVLVPLDLIVFACTDLWTAVLALVTLPIAPFLLYLIGLVTKERSAKEYRAMMRMGTAFAELLRAIPMMKLFGRARAERDRIADVSNQFRDAALAVLRTAFVSSFALELITTLSIALIAVSLGLRLVAGSIRFEPAFFVLLLAPAFYAPFATSGSAFHACMEGGEALKHLLSFLADAPLLYAPTLRADPADALAFFSVTCAYPGRTTPAVHDVTFSVPCGKIAVLTGTSGAGKSTIFALALGFLTPTQGCVSRRASHTAVLGSSHIAPLAYVPQEPHVFHDTLRENLMLGRTATDAQLCRALSEAGLVPLLSRLPDGLDTMLGDGARSFSNGERRRLGLARALVVPAKLYLFDEVTAGLDEANERAVLQTICQLRDAAWRPGILMASHRKTTIAIADEIVTIDGGTICKHRNKKPLPLGEVPSACEAERVAKVYYNYHLDSFIEGSSSDNTAKESLPTYLRHPFRRPAGATFPRGEGFLHLIRLLPVPLTLLALLSGLFADAAAVLLLGASAWLIASASFHPHLAALAIAITGVRASGIGRAVFRYLDRYLSHRAVFTLLTRLRLAVYDLACMRLPERRPGVSSSTFLQTAATGIDELRDFYLRTLFPLVRIVFLVIITAFLAAQERPALAVIPLLCALLLVIISQRPQTGENEDTTETCYRNALLDVFDGRTEIASFAARPAFVQRLNSHAHSLTTARWQALRREALEDAVSEALPSLAWVAMFAVLAGQLPASLLPEDGVHFAVIVMVLQTLLGFCAPLAEIVRTIRPALRQAAGILPFAPAEDTTYSSKSSARGTPHPSGPPPLGEGGSPLGKLRFCQNIMLSATSISFSYASAPIFRNFSFSLRPGEKLLLLGESGAGKTTLFHLLTRLWEADAGTFTLAGRPYDVLSVDEVRAAFAAATQAGYVFSGSLREMFDRLLPEATSALRRRALTIACCDTFLSTLPQGVDTPLGEDGVRLSGGQRQRVLVALAVAALLAHPDKILLLDEPTTGLDHRTAALLLSRLMEAFPTQTMILILHDRELAAHLLARNDARAIVLPVLQEGDSKNGESTQT